MGKERNSDQWFALWALLGLCAAAALAALIWIGVDFTLRNSGSPNPAPSVVHPTSPLSSNVIPRDPAARRAELAMIPAPGTRPAMVPTVSGPRVSLAISPVLIQGAATSDPMRIAMHPSLAPPAGVKPATEPVDASTLSPGTYAYAVNLELQRRFVISMCTDQQGNLWVGTEGGGVQRFNPSAPKYQEWTQFTTKDGLGDDNGYAIACDQQNRIWVGHLNHGVSVFNGQKWQNYEVVAGLSRPDTLAGPLGERIFHITVCPADGDVWMASSCGLARYSIKNDAWSYITRADGLPSDQANSIAFDPQGNIYVATQCDGIAMADASDNYKHWRQVTGPDEEPTQPTGDGLPTNLMNDILVAKDGTVYAATDVGLAWSKDNGITWKYVRGKDWAEKVRRRTYELGPEIPVGNAILSEDYCTCLGEASPGSLLVGFREKGWEIIQNIVANGAISASAKFPYLTSATQIAGGNLVVDSYGQGTNLASASERRSSFKNSNPIDAKFPISARSPTKAELVDYKTELAGYPTKASTCSVVGDDWSTEGDWVGRYGRQYAMLFAANWPRDRFLSHTDGTYIMKAQIGPVHDLSDYRRSWMEAKNSSELRCLYDPYLGHRLESETDDHGEVYPAAASGPDLVLRVTVPAGATRIALYFCNHNGHSVNAARRDLVIDVMPPGASTPSCRTRVEWFYGGIYKLFATTHPGSYTFTIHRNHSLNTTCCAIFIDRLEGPSTLADEFGLPDMGRVEYAEPRFDRNRMNSSDRVMAADDLYDKACHANIAGLGRSFCLQSFRAANDAGANQDYIDALLWRLCLWNSRARDEFSHAMDDGYESWQSIRFTTRRPDAK